MAVTTAHSRFKALKQVFGANGCYRHLAREAQETLLNATLQHQVGTGIGAQDAGYRTALAKLWSPRLRIRILIDEAAFLLLTPPVVIGIVVAALLASRGNHSPVVAP